MGPLDDPFVKLPHSLLTKALSLGLSGCEWDVLLLLVRFSYGFHQEDCSASLTRLANKCSRSRRQVSRALQRLCKHGLIELCKPPDYRHAGQYTLLDQCDENATVAETPQAQECHTEKANRPKSDGDIAKNATPSGINAPQSGIDATQSGTSATPPNPQIPRDKEDNTPKKHPKETLLKKPIKENEYKDMSIASGNTTRPISLKDFENSVSPSATKGTSPPGPPKEAITDDSVNSLCEFYELIRKGRPVNLSKTEIRELKQLWSEWPSSSRTFANSFIAAIRMPQERPYSREADSFMEIARNMKSDDDPNKETSSPEWMTRTAQFLKKKKEKEQACKEEGDLCPISGK
jgi:predicted transcriptional regulator